MYTHCLYLSQSFEEAFGLCKRTLELSQAFEVLFSFFFLANLSFETITDYDKFSKLNRVVKTAFLVASTFLLHVFMTWLIIYQTTFTVLLAFSSFILVKHHRRNSLCFGNTLQIIKCPFLNPGCISNVSYIFYEFPCISLVWFTCNFQLCSLVNFVGMVALSILYKLSCFRQLCYVTL